MDSMEMSHRSDGYIDVFCSLPREFILAYPQPRSPEKKKKKGEYRNRNAVERTSFSLSSKYKPKHLLDPYKRSNDDYANEMQNFHRRIESTRYDQPLQLIDGNKKDFKSFHRISSWRKLQANITASHYKSIQQFQCERQQHRRLSVPYPIMRSPLIKQQEIDDSQRIKLVSTSLSINSHSNERSIRSINEDSSEISKENTFVESDSISKPSFQQIEEFQPVMDIVSSIQAPSILLHDLLASFSPTISTSCMLFDHVSNITERLLVSQPSTCIQSDLMVNQGQPRKFHSLVEAIEELCLLIRKLLQYELNEQKITSLQATIANQLAILLTYLAMPSHQTIISQLKTADTMEKMTSTEEENNQPLVCTIGTQTESENILTLPENERSHTDLISTSVTLHLPGRRLNHTLSDTFIYQVYHHSSSQHHLISFSETNIHSSNHLLQRLGQKFEHYVELKSSNTWLEASTEFTPDFVLTTINSSKYDDEDQTQQFGIDTEKQDYQTEMVSLMNEKNQPKIDTLTFNSTEKENDDSLELDIEQDVMTDSNSIFLNDDRVSSGIHRFIEPLLETYQWQVPILPRKTNSIDSIYEKRTAIIRSNSNNGINLIGKQVRIKSNPSSGHERSRKFATLNINNNCHQSDDSIQSLQLSSTASWDSLCSLESDTLDKKPLLESNGRILPQSSHLADVTDKLDSNIAIAQSLLNMLNSVDEKQHNHSSTTKIDVLHMYIRQFLIEFDARVRLARQKSRTTNNTLSFN